MGSESVFSPLLAKNLFSCSVKKHGVGPGRLKDMQQWKHVSARKRVHVRCGNMRKHSFGTKCMHRMEPGQRQGAFAMEHKMGHPWPLVQNAARRPFRTRTRQAGVLHQAHQAHQTSFLSRFCLQRLHISRPLVYVAPNGPGGNLKGHIR